MLPLNKLHLIKEITINLIMFYLEHSSGSYVKLTITLERESKYKISRRVTLCHVFN
jgi:hypothetical protein